MRARIRVAYNSLAVGKIQFKPRSKPSYPFSMYTAPISNRILDNIIRNILTSDLVQLTFIGIWYYTMSYFVFKMLTGNTCLEFRRLP